VTADPRPKPPACPICGKPRDPLFRPFCSRACRDRDLMNWLDGRYAVPSVEVDEDGAEGTPGEER
jgi:endogenous inhibitor of DNA gyrase (YacG/DUF329 family)